MEPTRILIADDHPHFRDGLRALLVSESDLEVVGEAGDGEEAISLAADLQPAPLESAHVELAATRGSS